MSQTFLRMGCDLELSKQAAKATKRIRVVKQMHAGSKLSAKSEKAITAYDVKYGELFQEKYGFPIGYRSIEDNPPEKVSVSVMWGNILKNFEFGKASRVGDQWFYRERINLHENGKLCAAPAAWRD